MSVLKKKLAPKKVVAKRIQTAFKPFINSRHPSHGVLRNTLPNFPFRALIRLGSTKTLQEAYPGKTSEQLARVKEINSIQGVKNSSSKLLMKQCFTGAGVKTADWWTIDNGNNQYNCKKGGGNTISPISQLPYPIIAKGHYGSRGDANYKLNNQQELETWMRGKTLSNYIFEKFYTYSKEYRLHVSKNGCFYTCRKLVRNDAPQDTWQRHDDVCNWVLEENPKFMKPSTWDLIVADCIKAKNALGLDICAFDVLVQGTSKTNPEWLLLESCSAPSFGQITGVKYKEEIIKLLTNGL
jgi:hypothetical protein